MRLSERLGGGDKTVGTVTQLWPDVPPFQGATKVEGEIPLWFFSRKDTGKEEALSIIIVQDEKDPSTNIFYGRVDTTQVQK
jgi:hypothetical protein